MMQLYLSKVARISLLHSITGLGAVVSITAATSPSPLTIGVSLSIALGSASFPQSFAPSGVQRLAGALAEVVD
jgi:hypothetical protein